MVARVVEKVYIVGETVADYKDALRILTAQFAECAESEEIGLVEVDNRVFVVVVVVDLVENLPEVLIGAYLVVVEMSTESCFGTFADH